METGSSAAGISAMHSVRDEEDVIAQSARPTPELSMSGRQGMSVQHCDEVGQVPSEEVQESVDKREELLYDAMNCILRLEKSAGSKQVNSFLRILSDPSFNATDFVEKATSVKACRAFVESRVQNTVSQCGFDRIEMCVPSVQRGSILYAKDVVNVLRRQVSFATPENFSFRPRQDQPTTYLERLDTPFFRTLYSGFRIAVMSSKKRRRILPTVLGQDCNDIEVQCNGRLSGTYCAVERKAMVP